jgi:hypothetical protein
MKQFAKGGMRGLMRRLGGLGAAGGRPPRHGRKAPSPRRQSFTSRRRLQ